MAYGIPEFPGTNYHDWDLAELICMYKKLTDMYQGLVNDMAALTQKLNQYTASVDRTIAEKVQAAVYRQTYYLQSQITALKNELRILTINLTKAIADEVANRKQADTNIINSMQSCYDEIEAWRDLIRTEIAQIMPQVDIKLDDLRYFVISRDGKILLKLNTEVSRLDKRIDDLPDNSIPVRNRYTGELSTTDKALEDMWNYVINWRGFTAEEWETSTYITCKYWNEQNASCVDFWTHGKVLLHYDYEDSHVWSYVSGKYVPLQTAIYEMYRLIKPSPLTAYEFDEKKLIATSYDNASIKAFCYDNWGHDVLKDLTYSVDATKHITTRYKLKDPMLSITSTISKARKEKGNVR